MGIVMDEYEWAERMLRSHDLGDHPAETLSRVAKYYYANNYPKREVRRLLDIFLVQCDPAVSLPGWSGLLDSIAKSASKYPSVRLDHLIVTEEELAIIQGLQGKQLQRLAFTLLCVAKYWDASRPENNHWVNVSDKEIMKMANISTSIKRQSQMFGDLRNAGLIRFSKRIDNLNVQVLFLTDGEPGVLVHDMRNLGYQYMNLSGGPFYECENCGVTEKHKGAVGGRPPKYCHDCASEIHLKQVVASVMRTRHPTKQT